MYDLYIYVYRYPPFIYTYKYIITEVVLPLIEWMCCQLPGQPSRGNTVAPSSLQ